MSYISVPFRITYAIYVFIYLFMPYLVPEKGLRQWCLVFDGLF